MVKRVGNKPDLEFVSSESSTKHKVLKHLSELTSYNHQGVTAEKNGTDFGLRFKDIWEIYLEKHSLLFEYTTFEKTAQKGKHFFKDMMNIPMVEMTSVFVSNYLKSQKEKALRPSKRGQQRCSFTHDLKVFKTILNWYRENIDFMFVNPVLKRHKSEGVIRKVPRKKKKMRKHELLVFFQGLGKEGILWRDFAEIQFFFSGRVQEVAGLQWKSVDFFDRIINVENVAIWDSVKNFHHLKNSTKNGEERRVPMIDRLYDILKRRLKERLPSRVKDGRTGKYSLLDFVFHENGQPLKYRSIQYRYNQALKKVGLGEKYSSTHILRHSMANLVRERLGIEHAQAVGGWKTRALVEHVYTEQPAHLTKDALENIEALMSTVEHQITHGKGVKMS